VSDELAAGASGQEPVQQRASVPARPKPGGSLALKIYKPGQGYYTRICTAIGIAVLAVFGARFLKQELELFLPPPAPGSEGGLRLPLLYGIPTTFLIAIGILTYWVAGLSRKTNDFFIATEGEMKKVSWSTRAEVIKSTKVVIVTVVILAALLFVFDIMFMMFFGLINVLKVRPPWLDDIAAWLSGGS
jgi:preprotein translocase subunit SecE